MSTAGARRRMLLLPVVLPVFMACDRLLVEPRPESTVAGVSFALADYDPEGLQPIVDRLDRAEFSLSVGGSTRDTIVPLERLGTRVAARLRLNASERVPNLGLNVRLQIGRMDVLSGSDTVDVSGGRSGETLMQVTPIASWIEGELTESHFDALGQTASYDAVVLFATGDTIPGATITWSVDDLSVVELLPDRQLVTRGNGTTAVVAEYGALRESYALTVAQTPVTLIGVGPADTTVTNGSAFQLRPFGTDPNDFPLLPGAPGLSWTASGPLTVDGLGFVTATGMGVGQVRVALGMSEYTANITVN